MSADGPRECQRRSQISFEVGTHFDIVDVCSRVVGAKQV